MAKPTSRTKRTEDDTPVESTRAAEEAARAASAAATKRTEQLGRELVNLRDSLGSYPGFFAEMIKNAEQSDHVRRGDVVHALERARRASKEAAALAVHADRIFRGEAD